MGPVQLDNPAAFDRGARDVFHVEGADVGQLVKLVVSVDGRGTRPLWHLDSITVSSLGLKMGRAISQA